jgi:hypothetical protein
MPSASRGKRPARKSPRSPPARRASPSRKAARPRPRPKPAPKKAATKPVPKPSPKSPAKSAPKPAGKAAKPEPATSIGPPKSGDSRRHVLSLSFLREGDEFLARLETDAGQITELKNRSLDQLLTLVANELEDLLE